MRKAQLFLGSSERILHREGALKTQDVTTRTLQFSDRGKPLPLSALQKAQSAASTKAGSIVQGSCSHDYAHTYQTCTRPRPTSSSLAAGCFLGFSNRPGTMSGLRLPLLQPGAARLHARGKRRVYPPLPSAWRIHLIIIKPSPTHKNVLDT